MRTRQEGSAQVLRRYQDVPGRIAETLRSVARRAQLDRAVSFALVGRAWQMVAGPITLLLIARWFSPEVQGFYYTFGSLLALQSFLELGLYLVIINVASHEWARLGVDATGHIVGDREALSRLASLARLVFRWYAVVGGAFVLIIGAVGYLFFSQTPHPNIRWEAPWLTLVGVTGLLLWTLPFISLLEGCNQIAAVNEFRLRQGILGTIALWLSLYLGGGLWTPVVMAAARLLCDLHLLLGRYRRFLAPLLQRPVSVGMDWKIEVWPMQWRLALSGLVNYFAYSLFNPVMFHYHGAAVAGQMGMTLQIVGALQSLAMAWVSARVPSFGVLIARTDYAGLDRLWRRTLLISGLAIAAGAGVIWGLVYGMNVLEIPLAQRLLGPVPTGVLLLSAVLMQVAQCYTAYMRAHKREPILLLSVTTSIAIGMLVWLLGARFGPIGAAAGYLAVMVVLLAWETAIWFQFRADVRAPAAETAA